MPAEVTACQNREREGLFVRAWALPCRARYPEAALADVRLLIDTGSKHTQLRLPAIRGVPFRRSESVYGIGGHVVPAMPMRAHLVFDGQLVTMRVLLIDASSRSEDGLIGLDLLRGLDLSGGYATVKLAPSAEHARAYRWRVSQIEEEIGAKSCGCWPALQRLPRP
jgi:hypothetical protein